MSSVMVAIVGNIFFVLGLWAYSITLNPVHAFGVQALGILIQYFWDDVEKLLFKLFY